MKARLFSGLVVVVFAFFYFFTLVNTGLSAGNTETPEWDRVRPVVHIKPTDDSRLGPVALCPRQTWVSFRAFNSTFLFIFLDIKFFLQVPFHEMAIADGTWGIEFDKCQCDSVMLREAIFFWAISVSLFDRVMDV